MRKSAEGSGCQSGPSRHTSVNSSSSTEYLQEDSRASGWQSRRVISAARILFLSMAVIGLSVLGSCQHKSTSVDVLQAPLPAATTSATYQSSIICGAYPGTNQLIASCGPDPINHPWPCQHPDGTFMAQPGQQIQFGFLSSDGLHCTHDWGK